MSYYDEIVYAEKPLLFLSTLSAGDSSGASVYTVTNTLESTSQPIIKGHTSSFLLDDSHNVLLESTVFANRLEFVIAGTYPEQQTIVVKNNNAGHEISINTDGISVKIYCDMSGVNIPIALECPILNWPNKIYFSLFLDGNNLNLVANDYKLTLQLPGKPLALFDNLEIGNSEQSVLIDGIGIFATPITNKLQYVNQNKLEHSLLVSELLHGNFIYFNNPAKGFNILLTNKNFTRSDDNNIYYLINTIANTETYQFYNVDSYKSNLPVSFRVDQEDWVNFIDHTVIDSSTNPNSILLKVGNTKDDFTISLKSITNANLENSSIATIDLVGNAFYPENMDFNMINFPQGIELNGSHYEGIWLTSDFTNQPKSIEIAFKPKSQNQSCIFYSLDGVVEYNGGTISGYTTYLNGALVTDLDDLIINQWNHLVLVKSSPTSTTFMINSNNNTHNGNIELLYVVTYENELTADDVEIIHNSAISNTAISIGETRTAVVESTFDNGYPYQVYSYPWAILSGGGS